MPTGIAGPGVESTPDLLASTGVTGADGRALPRGAVGHEQLGQRVVRGGATGVVAAVPGRCDRLMSRALAPSVVVASTSAPADSRTRTISGASPPGPAATAACSGVRPVCGSRRSTSAPASSSRRTSSSRAPPEAEWSAPPSASAPRASRSRAVDAAPPRAAQESRSTPVTGSVSAAPPSSCRVSSSTSSRKAALGRVELRPQAEQQGHEGGRELEREVQRRPVVLGPRAEVGAGLDQHPDDVGVPLRHGQVQRRPAALVGTLDGPAEQAGGGRHGRPHGVGVTGGDEPAQAVGGHPSGHACIPALGSLDGAGRVFPGQTTSRRTASIVPRKAARRP